MEGMISTNNSSQLQETKDMINTNNSISPHITNSHKVTTITNVTIIKEIVNSNIMDHNSKATNNPVISLINSGHSMLLSPISHSSTISLITSSSAKILTKGQIKDRTTASKDFDYQWIELLQKLNN